MARSSDSGGWDFVKVNEIYQYKEDSYLAMVKVIEDNSDTDAYKFKLEVQQANYDWIPDRVFDISFSKSFEGCYSGQVQLYENEEYILLPYGTPWPFDYTK